MAHHVLASVSQSEQLHAFTRDELKERNGGGGPPAILEALRAQNAELVRAKAKATRVSRKLCRITFQK